MEANLERKSNKVSEENLIDNKNAKWSHNISLSPKTISSPCSNASSPGPYYRTDPEIYCQKCKNEISDAVNLELPTPVQFFDFITGCPSPWLHYGYCTPCLVAARKSGTEIINHITQCEALFGHCRENNHENHIEHYKRTEEEISLII